LTREELAELEPQRTRSIEIQDFVDLDDIDPIYFEQPYYLGPDKGAAKAYALLVQAMSDSRKVAVARFVLRNKEHLAAIRPSGGVLTLTTMRFADEVVPPEELGDVLPAEKPKVAKREVEMAEQLIDSLTREFDPNAYRDEYREELLALIERKAEGKDVLTAAPTEEPQPTKAPDLMAALEESIAAVKGKEDGKARKPAAAKKSKSTSKKRKPAAKRSSSRAKSKSSK
jgi:DNA end-binding protein Ku